MFTTFLLILFMFRITKKIFSKIHYSLSDKRLLYLLDPILVNKLNGPASVWAMRCRISKRPVTSCSKRNRRPEDRGTITRISDSIHYKRRSTLMKNDMLKTLERATPIHRSCFHLALDLLSYRSRL